MSFQSHWDSIYCTKTDADVSWTQAEPRVSMALIRECCRTGKVIDIGGGNSKLVGRLVGAGYGVAALDISQAALARARARLEERAVAVQWIVADITKQPVLDRFDVWHDRAVFHFLTDSADRAAYAKLLRKTIPARGHAIIATFALDGPEKCSGLPVQRYSPQSLAQSLGAGFDLIKSVDELHVTPQGAKQSFQCSILRRT